MAVLLIGGSLDAKTEPLTMSNTNRLIKLCHLNYISPLLEAPLIFILFLTTLIDTCARKQLFLFYLTIKIGLVEEVYYLKQVFHLLFFFTFTYLSKSIWLK